MRNLVLCVVVAGALAGGGLWGWRALSASPEKAIRQRLGELARTASYGPKEGGVARMLDCDKLAGFFAEDVEVKLEVGNVFENLSGRENVREAAMSARMAVGSLKVEFHDMNIAVGADRQSAEVDLTATGKIPGEQDLEVCELKFLLKQIGGQWMIRRVETVRTLR
jgi:ketosteroid isomerase-like protein